MISLSIQTVQKKMYFHSCISFRGCALFSLWNSPHHGRPKAVENKGSNVPYSKINITFTDWVKVKNIIPRNMIINRGCASVYNHIPRDDIFDYHPIRECNIYKICLVIHSWVCYIEFTVVCKCTKKSLNIIFRVCVCKTGMLKVCMLIGW